MSSANQVSTYAETAKKRISPITTIENPTDEQGIIFNHTGEHTIRDYLLALSELVGGPKNIIAASRVSGSKIIVFLKTKELVHEFQSNKGGFQLGQLFFPTKKLKPPTTKLLMSNVSPTIPNDLLEDILVNTLKLKLLSPMTYLRVNPNDEIFGHIISWRRQVYISSKFDSTKIPPTIEITHNSRTYRIFFSADNLACFKCGNQGHKAEDCPQIGDQNTNVNLLDLQSPTPSPSNIGDSSIKDFPPINPKRSAPSTASETSVIPTAQLPLATTNAQTQVSSAPPVNKKLKTETSAGLSDHPTANTNAQTPPTPTDIPALTIDQIVEQVKSLYADPAKYKPPIAIENLATFIDSCRNPSKDAILNLQKYNVRSNLMIPILQRSHSLIQNAKTKSRITRIVTALSPPSKPPT